MSAFAHKARALSVRHRLDRCVDAFLEWQAQPSFRGASAAQRKAMRAAAVKFVRELQTTGCPARLAVALSALRYGAAEVTIRRWIRRMESAPPGRTEVPVTRPPGRPPRAWSAAGAEWAYRVYLVLYGCSAKKSSIAAWRTVQSLARPRGLTIPCEAMFRRRLRREVMGGR